MSTLQLPSVQLESETVLNALSYPDVPPPPLTNEQIFTAIGQFPGLLPGQKPFEGHWGCWECIPNDASPFLFESIYYPNPGIPKPPEVSAIPEPNLLGAVMVMTAFAYCVYRRIRFLSWRSSGRSRRVEAASVRPSESSMMSDCSVRHDSQSDFDSEVRANEAGK